MLQKIDGQDEKLGTTLRIKPHMVAGLNKINSELSAKLIQQGYLPIKASELVHYFIEQSIADFDADAFIAAQKAQVK